MSTSKDMVIIGFGNQAKAWALNLRDSGWQVKILLRPNSSNRKVAEELGFQLIGPQDNIRDEQNFALLIPDDKHASFMQEFSDWLKPGSRIIYAHGYSVTQGKLQEKFKELKHLLFAPKAIASELRFQYETNGKLGACKSSQFGTENDDLFLDELAKGLGITAGPYPTTFKEETQADLFSEQTLLCSLLPYGALHSFNKLRERGIAKEVAYLECWYEVKLIVDAMVQMGPDKFFDLISPNALIGGEKAQKMIFNSTYHQTLESLMTEIENGTFFKEVDEMDFNVLKEGVKSFWEKEELPRVHREIGPKLFGNENT